MTPHGRSSLDCENLGWVKLPARGVNRSVPISAVPDDGVDFAETIFDLLTFFK